LKRDLSGDVHPTASTNNAKRFVWFRVFFNARFYYPVLAVFFVDLGLTLDQYALLNVAWAASIVLLEVPLGAIGDQIGRKKLVVSAAVIMVVEMAVLGFFPTGNATLLFWVLLANRILSGAAEAAASGADEALAYDSLKEAGCEAAWPDVLSKLSTAMAVAFMGAMLIGAVVYDPEAVGWMARKVGITSEITQATTVRFPVYLTFGFSFCALYHAWRMDEPEVLKDTGPITVSSSLAEIRRAAAWIGSTRYVLLVILLVITLDSVVRLFLTVNSSYFRLLGLTESWFGPLGAGFAALGAFTPPLARRMIKRLTARSRYLVVAIGMVTGLTGMALYLKLPGLLFLLPVGMSFQLLGFFVSHDLNRAAPSDQRATILSFKSLANNLLYGLVGVGFAALLRGLAGGVEVVPGSPQEEAVFARALIWLPLALAVLAAPLLVFASATPKLVEAPGPDADPEDAT
jgi:MFS family permease